MLGMALAKRKPSELTEEERDRQRRFITLRQHTKLTQEDVARMLGLSFMTVSRWERGVNALPEEVLLLLPKLAAGRSVEPCAVGKKLGFSVPLAEHIPMCLKCRRLWKLLEMRLG